MVAWFRVAVVSAVLVVGSCKQGGESPLGADPLPSADSPDRPDPFDLPEPCGPSVQVADNASVRRLVADLSEVSSVIERDGALYWQAHDKVYRLELGMSVPTVVYSGKHAGSNLAFDANAWYWIKCGIDGCVNHGPNYRVIRVDRQTDEVTILADDLAPIDDIEVDGDHVYIGAWSGGLSRVSRTGGKPEVLWEGGAVMNLVQESDTLYWIANSLVAWSKSDRRARVLAEGLTDGRDLVTDETHVYFVDRGEAHWSSEDSGAIMRVAKNGGEPEVLFAPIRWPEHITLVGNRVYVLQQSGTIVAVPKQGGALETVAKEDKKACGLRSVWITGYAGKLYWMRSAWSRTRLTGLPDPPDRGALWELVPAAAP